MNNPKSPAATSATIEKKTIVEEGTGLKGSMTSTCPIVVQGTIEGEVSGPSVDVSATGSVSGKIQTGTLSSKGRVAGELDVDVAQLAGTVGHKTVVKAGQLDLKLNATTGKIELKFGGKDGRSLS